MVIMRLCGRSGGNANGNELPLLVFQWSRFTCVMFYLVLKRECSVHFFQPFSIYI